MTQFATKKRLKELKKAHDLLTPHVWAAGRGEHKWIMELLLQARVRIADALEAIRTLPPKDSRHD